MSHHPAIWAKQRGLATRYPLICHLLDTACVAEVLWEKWLREGLQELLTKELGPQAKQVAAFAAGCHDIGKASPVFAGQLCAKRRPDWAEEAALTLRRDGFAVPLGGNAMLKNLKLHQAVGAMATQEFEPDNPVGESWRAQICAGHHGQFGEGNYWKEFRRFAQGKWAVARSDLMDLVAAGTGISISELPERISPTAVVLLSGLTIIADRTASNIAAVQEAQAQMAQGNLDPEQPVAWIKARKAYFENAVEQGVGCFHPLSDPRAAVLGKFSPRPLQEAAEKTGGGMWLVMTPTGSGKTEAALLRHAARPERLVFLLPTQATTNAIMRRVQRTFADTPNVAALAHGLASVEDFYANAVTDTDEPGGLFPSEFVKYGSARLLAPVVVGTVDQALMGALPLKWTHLRLLALANSHVVIDEVHTLDQYMTGLLGPLLHWLGKTKTRVTLLSATLPTWQRDIFTDAYCGQKSAAPASFPSLQEVPAQEKAVPTTGRQYQIDLEKEAEAADSVAAHVTWVAENRVRFPRARIGVICNTIDRALAVARAVENLPIGEAKTPPRVLVLHSRMTAGHRKAVAEELENLIGPGQSGENIVVVGTQAIEASLDIDLDLMSTDLAPGPSLIQRAGRVWRRDDPQRSERIPGVTQQQLRIVRSPGEVWALPYFEAELARTWAWLQERALLAAPEEVQSLVEESAFDIAAMEDNSASYAEAAKISQKSLLVSQLRVPMREILAADTSVDEFRALTDSAMATEESAELTTRYVDRETVKLLLVDPHGATPGAWAGTVTELARIRSGNLTEVRRALRGSVNVSPQIAKKLSDWTVTDFAPQAAVLRSYRPVMLTEDAPFGYDAVAGLAPVDG